MQRDDDIFSRFRPDQLNWIIRNNPKSLAIVLDAGIDVSSASASEIERYIGMVNRIDVLREICEGGPTSPDDRDEFFREKLVGAIDAWHATIEQHASKKSA
jgi:hypothetical protein